MMAGRPTKLTKEIVEQAQKYLDSTSSVAVQALLPTIEGLALELHISRDTVYEWEKVPLAKTSNEPNAIEHNQTIELHQQFSDIVSDLRAAQGQKLIQNSLLGRYNATIAKLILSGKHNYVEKSEVDNNIKGDVTFVNDVPRPKQD